MLVACKSAVVPVCTLIRVTALPVSVMVTFFFFSFFFAGSQQSQDQMSRRSGNTGEKHNENGVRLN